MPDERDDDETLGAFLDFLEKDIEEHPERLRPVTREFYQRLLDLTADVEADIDTPIEGDVAL